MTNEDLIAKSQVIEQRLIDAGLGGEFATLFGFMLGQASRKFGGWDQLDAFLSEYFALMVEMDSNMMVTLGIKPKPDHS